MDVHILPMKFDFLPQTFAFTSFNSKWMTALPAYLTYMVAAYMELIRSGEIGDECALAKQLHVIRKETIQAAQALARARYKRIIGTEDFTKRPPGCSGLVGCNAQYLTFKDLTTGVSAGWAIDDVHAGVIWPAENDAAHRIMEQLVSKVNRGAPFSSTITSHEPASSETIGSGAVRRTKTSSNACLWKVLLYSSSPCTNACGRYYYIRVVHEQTFMTCYMYAYDLQNNIA